MCVCNSTYCDDIEPIVAVPYGFAVVVASSLSGLRFQKTTAPLLAGRSSDVVTISVDARKTFQPIIGFGGAFTDSVGINLASLSEKTRGRLLSSYFGKNGLEYNLARVPIASTDFSTREYSYADTADDLAMKHFALAQEDLQYKIPHILTAANLTGGNIRLFASPWSAPGWMKTNGHMKGGGSLRGEVNGKYYRAYAKYLVKFFEEYFRNGVRFWGMTLQNEPSSGTLPFYGWQTMFFTPRMQRDFVKVTLGPMFESSKVTKDLKVMALDDNRMWLPGWADTIFDDPEAAKFVDGIGVHWYLNALASAEVLTTTHNRHPEKFILATEACAGSFLKHGPIMGDWYRAEEYAADIITDLNNFVSGWTDWNMCLDEQGGPSWVGNFVDSPIIVNATADEFYKQPMFYAMGHFSKFFKADALRVQADVTGSSKVMATATVYKGRRAVTILNRLTSSVTAVLNDVVALHHLLLTIEPNSIVSVIWDKI